MLTISEFTVRHKGKILYDCMFSDENKSLRNKPLTTIIIGENGSGKSYLLALIGDFYKVLRDFKDQEFNKTSFKYECAFLRYYVFSDEYEVTKQFNSYTAKRNGIPIDLL